MKKIIQNLLRVVFVSVLVFGFQSTRAFGEQVNLVIKNNGAEVVSLSVPLLAEGLANVNDSEGSPHEVNARSVLKVLNNADASSSDFNISSLIYYSSFGAFYLKCIDVSGAGDLCDGWQYNVNGDSPDPGMDQSILSGGETVTVFFGSEEEEEETPVEEVVEAEVSNSGNSSGSRSRRQAVDTEDVDILEDDEPTLPEVVEEISKSEVQPTLAQDKVVEKKVVPVKKVVPIKKPVVQNPALALNAINPVSQDEPKQVSWFGKLWSWLFGN